MRFVQNFTPPEFQAETFTLSISPNFNSFSKKKHKQMSENGEIYTAGKNFTLPPALTAWANSTSGYRYLVGKLNRGEVGQVYCPFHIKGEIAKGKVQSSNVKLSLSFC